MRKQEESTKNQAPIKIESEIADWLVLFKCDLEKFESTQMKLHSSLMTLNEQCFSDEEKQVLSAFLNNALALSFVLKDHPAAIDKFIEYNT